MHACTCTCICQIWWGYSLPVITIDDNQSIWRHIQHGVNGEEVDASIFMSIGIFFNRLRHSTCIHSHLAINNTVSSYRGGGDI